MCSYRIVTELYQSEAIERRSVYRLLLPEQRNLPVPLLILLHGVHGAETDWTEQGGLLNVLNKLSFEGRIAPMAVLTPSDGLFGIGTGYRDWAAGSPHRYETFLLHELIPEVERRHQVGGSRSSRSIAGLSMGGFAALSLAMRKPDRFASASSLSGFFDVREMNNLVGNKTFNLMFLGDTEAMDAASPLIMKLPDKEELPFLAFDCGREDAYLAMNRALHERLLQASIPHRYDEYDGSHSWEYWCEHIADHLCFHDEIFSTYSRGVM